MGSHFQNHPDAVILQKYQPLSNQNIKQNSMHMLSLILTPTLSLELMFVYSSLTVTTQNANAASLCTLFKVFFYTYAKLKILGRLTQHKLKVFICGRAGEQHRSYLYFTLSKVLWILKTSLPHWMTSKLRFKIPLKAEMPPPSPKNLPF